MATPFLNTEAILAVMNTTELVVELNFFNWPELAWFFSSLISTTDSVVYIIAKMDFNTRFFNCTNMIFHIFIVITQDFCYIRSLYLLFKVWSAVPIMSTLNRFWARIYIYASYYLAVLCIFKREISISITSSSVPTPYMSRTSFSRR